MTTKLTDRLNQILPCVTSEAFLSSEGIGNEIAFHIFDYPAEAELPMRQHIHWMMERIQTHHANLNILHLNLFDVVVDYLERRKLLDKVKQLQKTKGDAEVLKALKGPLSAEKVRDFIAKEHEPHELDLLLLSGVGSVWPMIRAHTLLNCLHTVMEQTPLVMFYPGEYDGTSLRLFGRSASGLSNPRSSSYYRAFRLVPEAC